MVYLLFTNRPEFAPFANKQMRKFNGWNKIVLTNKSGVTPDLYPNADVLYYDVENNTDMFNRFRLENLSLNDGIFISDDDVYYADWVQSYVDKNLEYFDRIVLTTCGIYCINTQKYTVRCWDTTHVGTGIALSKDLWKWNKWKRHPDGMVFYHNHLPLHDVRKCCRVGLVHLIHNNNMVLKESLADTKRYPDDMLQIPKGFINDIKFLR